MRGEVQVDDAVAGGVTLHADLLATPDVLTGRTWISERVKVAGSVGAMSIHYEHALRIAHCDQGQAAQQFP